MKKGFTLIELLAVIIILAVIALIATPIVLDVVESAKISAFESTAYGMIDAMKLKSAEDMIDGNSMAKEYTFPSTELDVQGSQLTGTGSVDKEGRLAIAVNNGKWCATKSYSEGTITIKDYVEGSCELPVNEDEVTYKVGDYIKIQVSPDTVEYFYVVGVDGNNVSAIMDRNYIDNISWGNSEDIIPTIANAALPTTWTNASKVRLPNAVELLQFTTWYQELENKSNWKSGYYPIIENYYDDLENSRLGNWDSYEEFRTTMKNSKYSNLLLPEWLFLFEPETPNFWTNDLTDEEYFPVYYVNGVILSAQDLKQSKHSVRPVIEIDKSYIIEKTNVTISSGNKIGNLFFKTEYNLADEIEEFFATYNGSTYTIISFGNDEEYGIGFVDLNAFTQGAVSGYAIAYTNSDYSVGEVIYSTTTFDLSSMIPWAKANTSGWQISSKQFDEMILINLASDFKELINKVCYSTKIEK